MTVSAVQIVSEAVESKTIQNKQTVSSISSWCSESWRKIISEFLSTTLLLLFGCMTCMPLEGIGTVLYSSLGFGMVVMFNIQSFGHVSGAHMNPAVTVASMIFGGCGIPLGIAYIIAQCLGAIAGYGLLNALTTTNLTEMAVCVTRPLPELSSIQTVGIEAAITAALMFVNCAMWDPVNKEKQETASIKFGLTIVGLSLVGGAYTGASMNPARSLGPAMWTNIWTNHWLYWIGPLLGSVVATIFYMIIFLQKPKD